MTLLAFVLMASCPKTLMVNISGHKWNKYDYHMLDYSKERCVQVYSDSPCVKLFRKWGEKDYSVICGAQNGKK